MNPQDINNNGLQNQMPQPMMNGAMPNGTVGAPMTIPGQKRSVQMTGNTGSHLQKPGRGLMPFLKKPKPERRSQPQA